MTEAQYLFLKELSKDYEGISLSEHIRRAIDNYIKEKKKLNVSSSQSKSGGEVHGTS